MNKSSNSFKHEKPEESPVKKVLLRFGLTAQEARELNSQHIVIAIAEAVEDEKQRT